ncbi:MAG: hypothetical protein J4215_02590 [Candidatus Diapherotrites archaeon]|uniref:Uncharacterized protein n=1 Tax=Candidatus Iainarchaeum sp. TaxID=3101447 RepID=A0A8T4L294_9ARCH|nr:hypothetical protein [Candidatus Diapherotrites archaeon]
MAILQTLSEWYAKAEDKFFSTLDWLDSKGVPVYAYSNALESRGIPSFPVTVCLIVLLLFGLAWLLFLPAASGTTLDLGLTDQGENALSGVSVKVLDESGKNIFEGTKNNGDSIALSGVVGKELSVLASKDGFDPASTKIRVRSENESVSLMLQKQFIPVVAQVRFVDSITGVPITNAAVSFSWQNLNQTATTDANGFVTLTGFPGNEDILVAVTSDNYESKQSTIRLLDGQKQSIPLVPKQSAQFGNAKIIVKVFEKQTQLSLDDAHVVLLNPQSNASYSEGSTQDGQFIADLPKGTVFVARVSKGGYVKFVSAQQTVRDEEMQLNVELVKGGTKVRVTVQSKESSLPLAGTLVSLYKTDGSRVEEQSAPFSGTVDFSGLQPDENYFVGGYLTGFVPALEFFSPFETNELTLELETESTSNMAKFNVFVTGSDGLAGNNAGVSFFEVINGYTIPTGLPTVVTEYDGYVSIKAPVGKNILGRASRGLETGDANKIVALGENNVAIRMKLTDTAKRLRVLGFDGNPVVQAFLHVESPSKEVLFDGNIGDDGSILFDAKKSDSINVTVSLPDGNVFSSQEIVKGKSEVIVRLKPNNTDALAPPIKFLGLEQSDGTVVQSLTPGTEYWAKFQIDWVEGQYRGGVHVRIGNDNEPFAESDDVGIMGFDAGGFSSFAYSRSYSPLPSPGNESLDLRNKGEAGQYNKWAEIYFDNPKGTQIIRVKVKAKETISKQTVFLHYRAWSLVGTAYHRSPEDPELKNEQFSNSKTALYAQTNAETLSVFSTQPDCQGKACATFTIVSSDGETVQKSDFTYAARGRVYAIEATIRSQQAMGALIKATTPKQKPKLFFTGSEVESFTQFIDTNSTQTAMEINDLSVLENVERKARIYFKPVQDGPATIHMEFLGEDVIVKEDFFFNVGEDKTLFVAVEPGIVNLGSSFKVIVTDDKNKGVENATVHIRDNLNAIASSIVGSSSFGMGRGGEYGFGTTMGAGEFTAEVSAPGYEPKTVSFSISANDALRLPEEIILKIPMGQPTANMAVDLENISAGVIRDISTEVQQNGSWPYELSLNAGTVSSLRQGQKGKLDVTGTFAGDSNRVVQGEADVIVKGYVTGKYPAIASTHVIVSYNQPLDPHCLVFEPKELTVYLAANAPYPGVDGLLSPNKFYSDYSKYSASYAPYYSNTQDQSNYNSQLNQGQYGALYDQYNTNGQINSQMDPRYSQYNDPGYTQNGSQLYGGSYSQPSNYYAPYSNVYEDYDNQQKELEIQVKNNCGVALNLTGKVVAKQGGNTDPFIQVTAPPLVLQPNESTTTTISVRNLRDRIVSRQETRNFDITYASNANLATLPLHVVLWDSRYALAMRDNIVMYLSQGAKGEPVISAEPIFVRNVGLQDIENFNIFLSGDTYQNGVDVRITPSGDVPILGRNQVIFPPKMLVAELRGGTDKGRLIRAQIIATGMINGKEMELRRANVWINVSAYECLRISPAESLDFVSQESRIGTIDKKIKVRNTCEEAVRVADIQPNKLGANEVSIVPIASDILAPDAEAEFLVRVVKRQDYKSQNLNFSVVGLTTVSRKFIGSNRLHALVELGQTAVSTGVSTEAYTINVCKEDGTISAETRQVKFPKVASTANCDKAYCDAELAAEYLLKKLDTKIAQARSAIGYGNGEVMNFSDNCIVTAQNPVCSFGQLDPKIPETFDLYLQNDRLSTDLLQKTISEKGSGEIKNYQVNYCAGSRCDAQAIAATGYPNLLMVSDNIQGCGHFRVSIDGAAFVNQNQIRTDGFTLAINVSNYAVTPECVNKIQNVHNFLPIDKTLTANNAYGTMMGMAEAETKLLPLAESFAKEFYGTSDGRFSENSQGNKVHIETGEVPGGIVKIGLDPQGTATDPKTITATINRSIEGVDLTQNNQNALFKEAANAFSALKSRQIPLGKGCISPNEDYFVLGSAAKLGDLTVTGPDKIDVLPQYEACIDLIVNSEIREQVRLETNAEELLQSSNAFAEILLKKKTDQSLIKPSDDIVLDENPASKKYTQAFQLCVKGSEYFQFSESASKIKVLAQSTLDTVRRSKEKEIGFQACGIHPYDLVNKLNTLEPGKEYYATVGWKGDPNAVTLSAVINGMAEKKLLSKENTLTGSGVDVAKQVPVQDEIKKQNLASILGYWPGGGTKVASAYLPTCVAVSAVCNGFRTLGLGGWLWGPMFDCGLPALWAISPQIGLEGARNMIENAFGSCWVQAPRQRTR